MACDEGVSKNLIDYTSFKKVRVRPSTIPYTIRPETTNRMFTKQTWWVLHVYPHNKRASSFMYISRPYLRCVTCDVHEVLQGCYILLEFGYIWDTPHPQKWATKGFLIIEIRIIGFSSPFYVTSHNFKTCDVLFVFQVLYRAK